MWIDGLPVGDGSFELRNGTVLPSDHPRFLSDKILRSDPEDYNLVTYSTFGVPYKWGIDFGIGEEDELRTICEKELTY